jgi:hypothetical protein
MHVRDEQHGAWWSPPDGVAYDGPFAGTAMRWNPYFQMTFAEFKDLHPDGEVACYEGSVDEGYHRNPRHGHGTDYIPGSPGIEPFFLASGWASQPGVFDERIPENTLVIAINEPGALRAYPLREVQKDGGVVHDEAGGRPIVVLSPHNSYTLGVFEARVGDTTLRFRREGSRFIDDDTGSTWTIQGVCESGAHEGESLMPIEWQALEWHNLASAHPGMEIYSSDAPPLVDTAGNAAFADVIANLDEEGFVVETARPLHPVWAPIAAVSGMELIVDGDRLELVVFETIGDAEDYLLVDKHAVAHANYVVRSNPERHFSNWAQTRILRDKKIEWSGLVEDEAFLAVVRGALDPHLAPEPGPPGARRLMELLADAGYRVRTHGVRWNPGRSHEAGPAYITQTPAGARDAFRVVIEGDCFLVLRFETLDASRAYMEWEPECTLTAGPIVLRSDPPGQYLAPYPLLSYDTPREDIRWSRLLEDDDFKSVCSDFADEWEAHSEPVVL